jgi:hypothetical protein
MSIKINGTDVVDNNRKGIFQSANVGTFSNPQRPGSAATGDLIWSTTDNQLQVWNGSAWVAAVGAGQVISASGGTVLTPGSGYKLHVFTSPGTFTLSNGPAIIEYAIVAGGGGGGSVGRVRTTPTLPSAPPPLGPGGGGGGGGIVASYATFAAGNYTVTVGGGGAGGPASPGPGPAAPVNCGPGSNGSNSSISGPSGTFTATGGGGGGGVDNVTPNPFGVYEAGLPGASGGGGWPAAGGGGSGIPGQGFPGASSTGNASGGGAGFPGTPVTQVAGDVNMSAGTLIEGWDFPASYGTSNAPAISPLRSGIFFGGGGGGPSSPTILAPNGYRVGGGGIFPGPLSGLNYTGGGGAGGSGAAAPFTPFQGNVPGPATPAGGNGGSGIVFIRYRPIQ